MTRLAGDSALLQAFRRGERAALEEVYREYARAVFAFFYSGFSIESGGKAFFFKGFAEPWAVEEAVQEVFVRAFAPAARLAYDGLRPYRNFLFTIGRNLVIDRWRAKTRDLAIVEETSDHDESNSAQVVEPPDQVVDSQHLASECEAFVASLDCDERSLFDARFRTGLSIEETARRLGISEYAAKRGEQRLKKRFFVRMKGQGYFEGYRYGPRGIEKLGKLMLLLVAGTSG